MASRSVDAPERQIRRVLVTGAAGFIGAHYVNELFRLDPAYQPEVVISLDHLSAASDSSRVAQSVRDSKRFFFVKGDVGNADLVRYLLHTHLIDTVVHFAAQSHVDRAYEDPLACVTDNVSSTVSLIESCRTYGKLITFVYVSTDEVYGDCLGGPRAEDAMLDPTNTYSASKASAEQFVRAYYHSHGLPVIITRSNNVYGEGQYAEKVVPRFVEIAAQGGPFTLQGDGSQLRAWLHVRDACAGIRAACARGRYGEVYNIGTDTETSIKELAQLIYDSVNAALGRDLAPATFVHIRDRPYNDKRYKITFDKANSTLGWREGVDFTQGLGEVIRHFLVASGDLETLDQGPN